MSRWADIDACTAQEISATELVGGIPLVIRPLRQLARAGWSHARVLVAGEDDSAAVLAALRRYPVADSLSVEVVRGERAQPGAAMSLDGCAIYSPEALTDGGPAPEPLLRIRNRSDKRSAEKLLYARIRKSVAGDGFFAHYMIRPLTVPVSRALLGTRITPNQVTVFALLLGIAAAVCAGYGTRPAVIAAGILYWLGNAFDCIDGDLARLRLQSSKAGEWLDSMTDEISTFSLMAGLGVGLWRGGVGDEWLLIGVGGSAIGALTVARLYIDLHRMGLPIDSAQFPWWFQKDAPAEQPEKRTTFGAITGALTYLVRRDANVTFVAIMLIGDLRRLALVLMTIGALVGAFITITHYIVMAARNRS